MCKMDPLRSNTIGLCVESKCNYYSSLEFPNIVEAGLFISHKGRSSIKYEVGIFAQDSEEPSAHGHFVHVFVDSTTRKPTSYPKSVDIASSSMLYSADGKV